MSDGVNLFLGGGAARGIWQVGFLNELYQKKIKTNEWKINNIYAISAGNFSGVGLLYNDHDLLTHFWRTYQAKLFPMFEKTKEIIPFYTWEDSSTELFLRIFFTIVEKKQQKPVCNFYSGVFNLNKLTTEWFSCHDKEPLEIEKIFFASSSVPLLYSVKKMNNNYYIDAGFLEYFLIKDFLNKHKGERNLVLTTFEHNIKTDENSFYFHMPDDIKKIVSFVENDMHKIHLAYEKSIIHGKKMFDIFIK